MEKKGVVVGVIGLGLMGGSAALCLKEQNFSSYIIGYDINHNHGSLAMQINIIDEFAALDSLILKSDIIIIATPVDVTEQILIHVLNKLDSKKVVIDFGSTKKALALACINHPNRSRYVACHPIAGTENSGPEAAFADLFANKINIICDKKMSAKDALECAEKLIIALGMQSKFMASSEHDRHIAYVSHLSHISSFTLGQTVLEVEPNEENIFDMAGSGFESTVRLAKSSPEMWAPIFTENAENILEVLSAYIANLEKYKKMIELKNKSALTKAMQQTNKIREILKPN